MEILARPEILPIRPAVSASLSHGWLNGFAKARDALRQSLHYEIILNQRVWLYRRRTTQLTELSPSSTLREGDK